MPIDYITLIKYAQQYDKECDSYPESVWDGKEVMEYILEKALEDGNISQSYFDIFMKELREGAVYES